MVIGPILDLIRTVAILDQSSYRRLLVWLHRHIQSVGLVGKRKSEVESTMRTSAARVLVVLAAVSLAASNVIGAERMVLIEQFGATW